MQFYFAAPKNIGLNSTCYLIMKFSNKRELQKITLNHLSDIDFKDFMNLFKKCTAKLLPFLVIDATITSDNPSRFRKNLLERMKKLIMTTDDKIRNDKLKYFINRGAAKIKNDKYEYLIGEEILPSNEKKNKKIEPAKLAYSPLGKAFEEQTKTFENQREK